MINNQKSLFIHLYLDEDVHKRLAQALRLRNFDVISAHELSCWGMSDEEQLEFASTKQRTLFTFNVADYIKLHLSWQKAGKKHNGIIVSNQVPIGEAVKQLLNLLNRLTLDEVYNRIYWLQAFK